MKRIAMVALPLLIVGALLLAGCSGVPQEEVDGQVSAAYDEGYNDGYNDGEEAGYDDGYQDGYDAYENPDVPGPVIVELNETIDELQNRLAECPPIIDIEFETVQIDFEELREFARRTFPQGLNMIRLGPVSLVNSVETVEEFLSKDTTLTKYWYWADFRITNDWLAFQLMDHWQKAGLPRHSFVLVEEKRGDLVSWRPMFIVKENGKLAIYELDIRKNQLIEFKGPSSYYRYRCLIGIQF